MKDFCAFVDFFHPLPLADVARLLSGALFAGIEFSGLDEGLWDEVPAMRLEKYFMGLRVELGGEPGSTGGFTLQVEPLEVPVDRRLDNFNAGNDVGDLSWYLRFLLSKVEGVVLGSA